MLTLSAASLVEGSAFTCTKTACRGVGTGNQTLFGDLQKAANALAAKIGLKDRIGVDNVIGGNTVELITQLAIAVPVDSYLNAFWLTTAKEVAANAASILGELQRLIASNVPMEAGGANVTPGQAPAIAAFKVKLGNLASRVFPQAPGIVPAAGSSSGSTVTVNAMPAIIPTTKVKYVLGGLLAAGLAVAGGYVISRRKK